MADPPPRPDTFTDNPIRELTVGDPLFFSQMLAASNSASIDFQLQISQLIAEAEKREAEDKRQAEAEQRDKQRQAEAEKRQEEAKQLKK